ncbi:MAG: site-2 protease family protein [Actinomycetota bacterium]|nr:site-2 protease family protein [Actinomycetota bacterium]
MSITVAILGLAFLILIHEAGHFFTALAVGMRPRRFYIGFPPALVKRVHKGVEYGIGAIPLGGYVKIPGMHRPAPQDVDTHFGAAQYEEPALVGPAERLKRCLELEDLDGARRALEELSAAIEQADLSPAAARAAKRGLNEVGDALGDSAYWRQPTWKRVAVIFAGPATNLVFAIVVLAIVFMLGVAVNATRKVDKVSPGSPAAQIGLRSGDEIVALNGHPVRSYSQMSRRIRGSDGKEVLVTVRRGGRKVRLGPVQTKKIKGHWALGFVIRLEYKHYSPGRAVVLSFEETGRVTKAIGSSLVHLTQKSQREQISSPVGIVDVSSQAAKTDYRTYLAILALLSLSLALLNLLPLLPLDGGHIVFSLIEGLSGRAVGRAVYERVSAIGIAIVLMLFVLGLSNDIGRLS